MQNALSISKAVVKQLKANKTKFGIKILNNKNECKKVDDKNKNTLWMTAHNKEIDTIQVAFNKLKSAKEIPPGYTEATGFMIYDPKMGFTCKARYV